MGTLWPELLVAIGDLVVLIAAFSLLLRLEQARADPTHLITWTLALVGAWLLFAVNQGAYRGTLLRQPLRSAYVASKAMVIAGAVFYLLPLVGGPVEARTSHVGLVLSLGAALFGWRLLATHLVPSTLSSQELVVVGAGWAGQALVEAIARRPRAGLRVVAFVDDSLVARRRHIRGIPLHRVAELGRLVQECGGRPRVVLANTGHAPSTVVNQLTALAQSGVEIVNMWSLYEEVTGQVPIRHLGHAPWAVLPRPNHDLLYRLGKRALDLVLATLGLLVLVILLPVLGPVLARQTGGSVFFEQWRVGWRGRPLRVIKLRTLPVHRPAPIDWRERKAANRASRLADFVRTSGLDELPQCWNVLRGEMSIVGPRPYMLDEAAALDSQLPFFACRTLVRPGLTGWAQTNYGYGLSLADEVEKLQYDLYYVGHQSTYLDLLVILRTLGIILRRRPASAVSLAAVPPSEGSPTAALRAS